MDHIEWFDAVRMITAMLSLISMHLLGKRYLSQRHSYSEMDIDFWWAINAMLVLLIVGSIEQIVQDVGFGSRTVLGFIVSVIFLRGSLRLHRSRKH